MSTPISLTARTLPCPAAAPDAADPRHRPARWTGRWHALKARWLERECRRGVAQLAAQLNDAERRDIGLHEGVQWPRRDGWSILGRTY